MDTPPPKIFISHSSLDKDRFARGLAKRLREDGVDAWLDEWEMKPGDSLIQRIFGDGIANADAFIIVLSKNSIDSNWVREELDVAAIRRIEDRFRIVPIVLDGVSVPEVLSAILHIKIADPSSYEDDYQSLLRAIHNQSSAPQLGTPPPYAGVAAPASGMDSSTSSVLEALSLSAIESDDYYITSSEILRQIRDDLELPAEQFGLELARLERDGLVELSEATPRSEVSHLKLMPNGLLTHLKDRGDDVEKLYRTIVAAFVNDEAQTIGEAAQITNLPILAVDVMVRLLASKGLCSVSRSLGPLANNRVRIKPLAADELL